MKLKKKERQKKRLPYFIDLPAGVPVNTGPFGSIAHDSRAGPSLHFHYDWDLLFVSKGCAVFKFKNGMALDVPANHFLLVPPSVALWRQAPESPIRLSFFHFSFYSIPNGVFPSIRNDCMELGRPIRIPWIFSRKEAPEVWIAYRVMLEKNFLEAGSAWRMASVTGRILSALGTFALKLNLPAKEPAFDPNVGIDSRTLDVFRRVSENPLFPWKVSELAESIGITPGHLHLLCRRDMGIKLKHFIIERRLIIAARLLATENGKSQSAKQISAACGFRSSQFFCRQFKKYYGISSLAYRRMAVRN